MEEWAKAHQQLDIVAKKTAELVARGNPNAQAIVAGLAKQGIKIDISK